VIKFHLKSNGINIGKQTRVSYFDKLNEQELTPKSGKVMSFDTSEDRQLKQEGSNSKPKLSIVTNSSMKPLSIDIEDEGSFQKSELRNDLTPKQVQSTKNTLLEQNMSNNA